MNLTIYNYIIRNSIIQCLLHSINFVDPFMSEIQSLISIGEISKRFYNLIQKYSIITDNSPFSIDDFRNIFVSFNKKFSNFSQHDAQEFLRIFIEDLGRELNKIKLQFVYQEFDTRNKSKKEINREYHNFFLRREKSIIIDIFYGEYCNTFKCFCGYETYSFEKVFDVPVLYSKFSF